MVVIGWQGWGGGASGRWSVEEHCWMGRACPAGPGHGLGVAVVGWCLPVQVVDEKQMT